MAYTLTYTLNSDGNSYTLSGYSGSQPTGKLGLPNSYNSKPVTSIGNRAFSRCSGLTSVTIPDSITSIGNLAFEKCFKLTSITIPNSVTSIGNAAFSGCSGITHITIPDSVTSIGKEVFSGCTKLQYNTYNNAKYLGNSNNPYVVLIKATDKYITSCEINEKTKLIYDKVFYNCNKLTSITIPDSVISIGRSAFYGCSGLTSITIPNSVTSVGYSAFEGCSGLTSVTIGNSVTSIEDRAFAKCVGLTVIIVDEGNSKYHSVGNCLVKTAAKTLILGCNTSVIPSDGSVTSIGEYAFYGCSGLTNISIPDSVTSIGMAAFYNCIGLTSITIPDSVMSISDGAFEGCSGLTSITIPDSVTSVGMSAFDATAWYNDQPDGLVYVGKVLYKYKGVMPINTKLIIKEEIKSIADSAFYGCSRLMNITLPGSVTRIGNEAFRDCSGLTSITIPDSVTSIGNEAFRGCSGLTSVIIGNSVTNISSDAFFGCSGLTTLNMFPTTPPTIQSSTFTTTVQRIYVPAQSKKTYITATNWNTYADKITEFPILDLGSLLLYNNKVKARIDADGNNIASTYAKKVEISNPNLLINPDFSINQRGQTSYSGVVYGVDRWTLDAGATLTPQNDGIKLVGACRQFYENPNQLWGKTVTLSFKTASGITSKSGTLPAVAPSANTTLVSTDTDDSGVSAIVRYVSSKIAVVISATTETNIYWAKLEIGSVATAFSPPSIAEELIKCQRYYQKIKLHGGAIAASTTKNISPIIPLPTTMRTKPTITVTTYPSVQGEGNSYQTTDTDSITVNSNENNGVVLAIVCSADHFTANKIYSLADGECSLDAEI